jgi:hypothetical protein
MEKEKSIIYWIETILLNVFTLNHQFITYILLVGKSNNEKHKIKRITQYLNFFKIIILIYLLVFTLTLINIESISDDNFIMIGITNIMLIFFLNYNLTIFSIYIYKVSYSIKDNFQKKILFIYIPIILLILTFYSVPLISFFTSLFYLLIVIVYFKDFHSYLGNIENRFINKHMNYFWHMDNFKPTTYFLSGILILHAIFSLMNEVGRMMRNIEETTMPSELNNLLINNYLLDIGLLILTIITGIKKAHNNV